MPYIRFGKEIEMKSIKNIKILILIIILTLFNACAKKEQSIQTIQEEKENTMSIANTSEEARRNASKNPFGLVYEGAITENEKGKVNIIPVSYNIRENKIAANVYTPANFDSNQKYPAIVVAHPNGGVKEQVSGLYAQRLAELGYITIAFDAAYQGGSEGLPRNIDTPANRVEDIRAAANFLSTFNGVDVDRLGVLGICGGGGYTIKAAQTDKRLKAVATISMFNSGLVRRNGFLNSQIDSIQARLKEASDARQKEVLTGEVAYTGSAPTKLPEEELAKITTDLYREGVIYYGDTHAHPNSTFAYTTSSLLDLMSFDSTDNVELINQPLLMIVGDNADTKYMSEEVFAKASGTQNKELYELKNATHIQTYFRADLVDEAVKKLEEFYKNNL